MASIREYNPSADGRGGLTAAGPEPTARQNRVEPLDIVPLTAAEAARCMSVLVRIAGPVHQ